MAELWKAWKTKSRFPTLSTAPWKSRKGGEIPTFSQLRLFVGESENRGKQRRLERAVEKWKSKNRIPTFPPP